MFHGLGKILYNKRQAAGSSGANGGKTTAASSPCEAAGTADGAAAGAGTAAALPGGGRPHPEADVEAVLEQSGMEPGPVSSFLHEHYASFVPQDAVEDAALALEYLVASGARSSSECHSHGQLTRTHRHACAPRHPYMRCFLLCPLSNRQPTMQTRCALTGAR